MIYSVVERNQFSRQARECFGKNPSVSRRAGAPLPFS